MASAPAPNPSGLSNHPTPSPSPGPKPVPPTQAQMDAAPNVLQAATGWGPAGLNSSILDKAKEIVSAPITAAQDAFSTIGNGFATFGNGILKVGSDLVTTLIVVVLFALGIFLIFHEQTFPLVQSAIGTAKNGAKSAAVVAAV